MMQKIKVLITFIAALLFPNSRLVLCQIFSYDFPKMRNLPKIFLKSFENVGPDTLHCTIMCGVCEWIIVC